MSTSSQQPAPHTSHSPQPRKAMRCFHRDLMIKRTLQFQLGLLYASEPLAGFMQQGGHRKKLVIGPLLSPGSHARTRTHPHQHKHTHEHLPSHARTHARMHVPTHTRAQAGTYTGSLARAHACTHAGMCAHAGAVRPGGLGLGQSGDLRSPDLQVQGVVLVEAFCKSQTGLFSAFEIGSSDMVHDTASRHVHPGITTAVDWSHVEVAGSR